MRMCTKLCPSDTMLSEGSFTKPKYFSQLMTNHPRIKGKIDQLCCYILLPKNGDRPKWIYKKKTESDHQKGLQGNF